jgi:two-component system, chemotaxis family, protein-glutamate methylesterase/glutaminase
MNPIKVLIIDDSAFIRQLLTRILEADKGIEVVGAAPNPLVAREMIKKYNPDVLTLDVEMPEMDGISFLDKVMRLRPMPVVMISSLTEKGAEITLQALSLGAVDFVAKPKADLQTHLEELSAEICLKVKNAAKANVKKYKNINTPPKPLELVKFSTTEKIIAIGASTGGVEALLTVMGQMPSNAPAVVITQHMPPKFTQSFAERLNRSSAMTVSEVKHGERLLPGHAYLAEGGKHLRVERRGANYVADVNEMPLVNGHRPSVDVLFYSVAENVGKNSVGIILTGMGNDGAKGLLAMQQTGAITIGQNEASCVVYGMPKAARLLGGVQHEVPLDMVASTILSACGDINNRAVRI